MIKVLKPGFLSTIQDLGRIGFRQYGVPKSGVMDLRSAILANALLNNSENDAVLEITMIGPVLEFYVDTFIAVTGANNTFFINDIECVSNKIHKINKGDILKLGIILKGMRSYLAVKDGFKTEIILNSRSFYKGITPDSKINKEDLLQINSFNYKIPLT